MIKVIAASDMPSNDNTDDVTIFIYNPAPLVGMNGFYVPVRWMGLCRVDIKNRNNNIQYLQEQIKKCLDERIKIKIYMNDEEVSIDEII